MSDTDYERAASSGGHNLVGTVAVCYGDGVCSHYFFQCELYSGQQFHVSGLLDISDELHEHFRVRVAAEGAALFLEPFFQRRVVFDDSVMHKCNSSVL